MRMMREIFKVKEIKYDLYFSIAITIIIIVLDILYHRASEIFKYTPLLTSVSITMAGFLITALAILISFPKTHKIKFMEQHPTYPLIFYTFIFTILLSLALFGISLFSLVSGFRYVFLAYTLIFFSIWPAMSIVRCVWLLKKMIDVYLSGKIKDENSGAENEVR